MGLAPWRLRTICRTLKDGGCYYLVIYPELFWLSKVEIAPDSNATAHHLAHLKFGSASTLSFLLSPPYGSVLSLIITSFGLTWLTS